MSEKMPLTIGDPCPNCAGRLVRYTIKKGASAGKKFLTCSNSPACQFAFYPTTQKEKDLPHAYH